MNATARARATVAIPTWNRAPLLRAALESVLSQTLADIEVFVSDNASSDDTAKVVAAFNDPRLSYTRLDSNIGLHANLSRCLRLGTAPFLVILQDDDVMRPDNVARKVAILERHPNVGLVHASFQVLDAEGGVLEPSTNWMRAQADSIEPGSVFIQRSFAGACRINMSAAMMRRSVIDGERFDVLDGSATDFGLWLRIAVRSDIAFLAEPLTALRAHADRDSVRVGVNLPRRKGASRTFTHVALAQQVKKRFLAEAGDTIGDRQTLLRLSREWARDELLKIVFERSLPERSPIETCRLLLQAQRIEPSVLWSARARRLLLASVVGSRGRAMLHRRSSPTP